MPKRSLVVADQPDGQAATSSTACTPTRNATCYVCFDSDAAIVFSCAMGHGMCAECHDRSAEAEGGIPTHCQYIIDDITGNGAASSSSAPKKCGALF